MEGTTMRESKLTNEALANNHYFLKDTELADKNEFFKKYPFMEKVLKDINRWRECAVVLKRKKVLPGDEEGYIADMRMRCDHSKLTTVRGLQSIGFETIAAGDSYNDLEMIEASKAGFLFRSTDKIKADYPQYPAFEEFDEFLAAIKAAL